MITGQYKGTNNFGFYYNRQQISSANKSKKVKVQQLM